MGDNCCHSFSMGAVEKMIQKHAPGVNYIKSLMIGDSPTQDTTNGFLLPVNDQLEMVIFKVFYKKYIFVFLGL